MPKDLEFADELTHISHQAFERIAEFTTRELGIRMPDSKVPMIQSRLRRRIRELGLNSLDEYCRRLLESPAGSEEHTHFFDAITTNKTEFFREPQHFRLLTEMVLPRLERAGGLQRRLNVWSAACSSGEEPYTLAMVLADYGQRKPGFEFKIVATDISQRVLELGADGIYPAPAVESVPMDFRRRYLLRGRNEQESRVRIIPELRQRVCFHRLNFMDADYGIRGRFDVVFCRNVLIYFDRPTQEAVINKLCRHLLPGGYLFVSHSESLSGLEVPVEPMGSSCFRRREA